MAGSKDRQSGRKRRGFVQTGSLLTKQIRKTGERRGFAETRLLTQWTEIAGAEIAAMARPLKVTYAREGFGATLVLLCNGASAPEVEMQIPVIRERVNACYGFNAISRVRLTQTAPAGFAEAQAPFEAPPKSPPDPRLCAQAEAQAADIEDTNLREALVKLGANVLSRRDTKS